MGGAIAIALIEFASARTGYLLMAISFATAIALVMGMPQFEPTRPRRFVCRSKAWAVAVGVAISQKHSIRSSHPPAGIDPLDVVINNMSWGFLLAPVAAGAVLLALFPFIWHNLARRGSWPVRW
jgi:hypothetical protein